MHSNKIRYMIAARGRLWVVVEILIVTAQKHDSNKGPSYRSSSCQRQAGRAKWMNEQGVALTGHKYVYEMTYFVSGGT